MSETPKASDVTDDLTAAVRWGNVAVMQNLLESGADPNILSTSGCTALHVAAECGEAGCATVLISHKADVNVRDIFGQTPLHKAIIGCSQEPHPRYATLRELYERQLEIARLLICCGADISVIDASGASAHDLAVQSNSPELINMTNAIFDEESKKLLKEKNQKVLVKACASGDVSAFVQNLPDFQGSIDEVVKEGNTLLMIAASQGHMPIVKFLLENGAQPTTNPDTGLSALHLACEAGHVDVVQCLLDRMPTFVSPDESEKGTSLFLAVKRGHTEMVKVLLAHAKRVCKHSMNSNRGNDVGSSQHRCIIGITATSHDARTPLHEAASSGHTAIAKLLVDFIREHIVPSLQNGSGVDLSQPLSSSSRSIVAPYIDPITLKGKTPFHEAANSGCFEVMELLVQAGADINSYIRPSIDLGAQAELTALVQACLMDRADIVKFLLVHGATDARLKALSRSLRRKFDDVVGLLLCHNGGVLASEDAKRSLKVAWKSKNLPYIRKEWLEMAVSEAPKTAGHSCAITELDISSNELKELPVEIFQLSSMTALDVSRNQLQVLPECGWTCSSLQVLDLSTNNLKCLPECVFTLPKLKELNATNNKINDLPMAIWRGKSLTKIFLGQNMLKALPSPLTAAEVVYPVHQYGRPHSASVLGDSDLTRSDISRAIIFPNGGTSKRSSREQKSILSWRHHLYSPTFDSDQLPMDEVENNEVSEGGEELICPIDQLDLSKNQLTTVPCGLSCLVPKLQKLNISKNAIRSLGYINDYPSELEVLDASDNQLHTAIAPSLFVSDGQQCAHRLLCLEQTIGEQSAPTHFKICAHRLHKNLWRLGNLKLNHNLLVEVQLFRVVNRPKNGDLLASNEETPRAKTSPLLDTLLVSPSSEEREEITQSSVMKGTSKVVPGQPESDSTSSSSLESSATQPQQPPGILCPLYPQLNTLEVAHNNLKSVPTHIHNVATLSCLNVSHNKDIDTLPLELSNLEHLWSLEYDGLPLTNPPLEDLNKYRMAYDKILYMKSLLHDAKPNESLKLMLVGFQKMGKTTLLSRLTEVAESSPSPVTTFSQRVTGTGSADNLYASGAFSKSFALFRKLKPESPLSTVGVDLGIWKYRKDLEPDIKRTTKKGLKTLPCVTFYTWDFGGQEEYYVTHQCFLSARSLYLAVWNVTDGVEGIEALGPWLHNIQARAPSSPVLIVGTHIDLLKPEEKEKAKADFKQVICQKFLMGRGPQQLRELGLPRIIDIIFVGCAPGGRGEGIMEMRKALYDHAFALPIPKGVGSNPAGSKAKLLEQPIPASFLKLEERVRQLAFDCKRLEQPPVMKEIAFQDATKDIIPNPRELNQAVTFLHENGVLLHYATPALSHLYFLDPQWLCDMLAHIITVPEVNNFIQRYEGPDAGILHMSVLSQVFKGDVFPQTHRQEYIELLGKFEVALVLNEEQLLVPSMLASTPHFTIHASPNVFPRPSLEQLLPSAASESDGALKNLSSTGLLLRRFYFMTYVPGGFWPRLISRFLSSPVIVTIVLTLLGYSKNYIQNISKKLMLGGQFGELGLQWSYWKTGIELWYKEHSLLRIAELVPGGAFRECKPSPPQYEHAAKCTVPIEPCSDAADLTFDLNGLWMPVDYNPNRGVEILVKDVVCPAVLKERGRDLSSESIWPGAQLLSVVVDSIDNLLEDWYPGLGARDGGKTSESIPYVNRVIPCPFCANGAEPILSREESPYTHLSNGSLSSPVAHLSTVPEEEQCDLRSLENQGPVVRTSSLQETESRRGSIAELDLSDPHADTAPTALTDATLTMATKFGFMIETCILSVRTSKPLVCPVHAQYCPLSVRDLAPDLMFADLAKKYVLDPQCVDKGEYVNHGSFGDIYHGRVYPLPTSTDEEGVEVAIKIDRMDSRKYSSETATKAYVEVRAEVSILHSLVHPNVIEFIGVVLQPLCFILEWAPGGSLSSIFQKYRKQDARIGPLTLQRVTQQVASGLAYLHDEHGIVYYDLKSPNILVFQFPSVQYSLQGVHSLQANEDNVHVKIADMGISRRLGPGGVMGFKGSPGFMAPEILKYVGTEACTEKVDIFSFGMFMYELIALHFPFEKQNLMAAQIEKLVVEGSRPQLQHRELNNPILFLDVMGWCWQPDFRNRPSASVLGKVLANPSFSRLVDVAPLSSTCQVTASCICTLPLAIVAQEDDTDNKPLYVANADLQEELWLCTFAPGDQRASAKITIINFQGKTNSNFSMETVDVCHSRVTSICSITDSMWLGDELGHIYIYDAMTRHVRLSRQLSVENHQAISSIIHLRSQRQVVVTREDGCVLLFDEGILDTKLPDNATFDNRVKGTALPVRAVFTTPQHLPILCAVVAPTHVGSGDHCLLCTGTESEMLMVFDVYPSRVEYCRRLHCPTATSAELVVTQVVCMDVQGISTVWGLVKASSTIHQWNLDKEEHLRTIATSQFTCDKVTSLAVMGSQLQLALTSGNIILLATNPLSSCELMGHTGAIYSLNSIGGRILPKHWFPTIIGRSNAIDYYRDLLSDEDIAAITSSMTGRQTRLLVSVGHGFHGVSRELIKPLMSNCDQQDNFVLLWCVSY